MGMTNAERQAAYRARHFKAADGERERLSLAVSVTAKAQLLRLTSCYGVTQREVVESLLAQAERALSEAMTEKEWKQYAERSLSLPRNGIGVTE